MPGYDPNTAGRIDAYYAPGTVTPASTERYGLARLFDSDWTDVSQANGGQVRALTTIGTSAGTGIPHRILVAFIDQLVYQPDNRHEARENIWLYGLTPEVVNAPDQILDGGALTTEDGIPAQPVYLPPTDNAGAGYSWGPVYVATMPDQRIAFLHAPTQEWTDPGAPWDSFGYLPVRFELSYFRPADDAGGAESPTFGPTPTFGFQGPIQVPDVPYHREYRSTPHYPDGWPPTVRNPPPGQYDHSLDVTPAGVVAIGYTTGPITTPEGGVDAPPPYVETPSRGMLALAQGTEKDALTEVYEWPDTGWWQLLSDGTTNVSTELVSYQTASLGDGALINGHASQVPFDRTTQDSPVYARVSVALTGPGVITGGQIDERRRFNRGGRLGTAF